MSKKEKKEKKKAKRYSFLKKMARATRLMKEMYERGQSDLCDVRNSEIHGRGVYAAADIANETRIIEYIGEYVDKDESEKRAWDQAAVAGWQEQPRRFQGGPASRCGAGQRHRLQARGQRQACRSL